MSFVAAPFARADAYYQRHPWAIDVTLLAIVTVAAAVLRLVLLGRIPYGVHSDEAQLGTDARKILDGELWTVYTKAVLGQPSGHAYLTLPSFELFGYTPFAMRLPLALVAIAAIPLLYLLVRVSYGRVEAFFSSFLLAVSYWHLFYSRVAHWSISYGTVLLGAFLCLILGINTRKRGWFIASGFVLGLGFYTYNIYPVAVAAFTVFVALLTPLQFRRGDEFRWWRGNILWLYGVAFVVALPMIVYVANPDSFYWFHINNYGEVRVTSTDEFKDAGAWGKTRLLLEQLRTFVSAYAWNAPLDNVDGNGIRAQFDPPTVVLLLIGFVIAIRKWRDPMVLAALCCFIIIPLPAMLQQGSIMRQPLAAAPFAMFIAALPLATIYRGAMEQRDRVVRAAGVWAVAALVAMITIITVHDYFWTLRKDPWTRFVYHSELTTAADYMRGLPDDAFILYYSEREPISLEAIQFLAPGIRGSDRSFEFAYAGPGSIEVYDRSRPTVFMLMDRYVDLLPEIQERHPGGTVREFYRDGKYEFTSYELPARVG